jgi:magnesium transporter
MARRNRKNGQGTKSRRRALRNFDHSLHPHTRPGTVIVPPGAEAPVLRVTGYGPDQLTDRPNASFEQIRECLGKYPVTWIDATGFSDAGLIEKLGALLGLHALSLEDMVTLNQRPKVEEYPNHLFSVTQIPLLNGELATHQLCIFTGSNFVLTWRERQSNCFDLLRKRLQVTRGVTRSSGVDYLTYAVLDAAVDSFFPVLEVVGDELDELDDRVEDGADAISVATLRDIRHEVRQLRRIAWPLRDALDVLMRKPADLIGDEAVIHLRDCHDHVVQIIDALENCRDACSDIRDYYATAISNRMNEIMKVLTVISTIFMPLSFVAGVYGMNFDGDASWWNMPELRWKFGYPLCLGVMAGIAAAQLVFFYRRGWLRRLDMPKKSHRDESRSA